MMKTYIGTKILLAECLTEKEFFDRSGTPYDKRTYDRSGYLIVYPDGYESWSPKEVFEAAYRLVSDDEKTIVCGGAA